MPSNPNNKLKSENSLYLKQHADQPVNWYPWGDEAIKKAKEENKPIFLSIGYSSCHWCHVMADESFDDEATAKLLNEKFVAIKVDREEYPDLDLYYQQSSQFFNQSGGWPLSAFLTTDLKPFFVGTYFPKFAKENNPSFGQILDELSRVYKDDHEKIENNANQVTDAMSRGVPLPEKKIEFPDHFPSPLSILKAVGEFEDKDNGGYGKAPKFPHFAYYEWAVEQMLEGMIPQEEGKHVVMTIENMLLGGMFDHVRGGIHRYSVDDQFIVPHFEKMLYDQAGLLRLLAKTSMLYPSVHIIDSLIKTIEYLSSEMLDDKGYFFSAQDADSEGQEGLYFTFTHDEFISVAEKVIQIDAFKELNLSSEIIARWFQVSEKGNFENGLNVISLNTTLKQDFFKAKEWEVVRVMYRELLLERKQRIPPATDNKGVSSWNYHLISGLCDVIQYARISIVREKATDLLFKVLEGAHKNFFKEAAGKMKLRHATTNDESHEYAEDYIFYAEAQLRCYEITGNDSFKQNTLETLNFIFKEFVKDNALYTRKLSLESESLPPNLEIYPFDQSFKSALSSLHFLTRRARVLFANPELGSELLSNNEEFKQKVLMSPIGCGEGLRANTYPDNIFRVVKVPRNWLSEKDYLQFINFFMPRFVIEYTDVTDNKWQVCNLQSCELQGEGLQNFIETLKPKAPQKKENE